METNANPEFQSNLIGLFCIYILQESCNILQDLMY